MADPPPPPAPPSLDTLLYALSQVTFCREYRPHSPEPTIERTPTGEHLKLLNLLSLLLVTSKKGDVAAVTLRLLPNSAQLFYAKNRPYTPSESRYIAGLLSIATSADPACDHATAMVLKQLEITFNVIAQCRRKINSRIQRLCQHLENLSKQNFSISTGACEAASTTAGFIRKRLGNSCFRNNEPLTSFLQSFFKDILATTWATMEPGPVYELLMVSYYVGNSPAISTILDQNLLNRLRKVGDYFAAPIAITATVTKLVKLQLSSLTIEEVTPEPPRELQLPVNFLTTINDWARHSGNDPITAAELDVAFPNRADPPSPDTPPVRSITTSVHCECTLILALLSSAPVLSICEIGVSKSSCWMCREFILIVKRMYPNLNISTSSCHGKIVAGWRLPEHASWELKRAVTKKVHDEVDEVLERAARKRRSDSLPRGTGSEYGDAESDSEVALSLFEGYIKNNGGGWMG